MEIKSNRKYVSFEILKLKTKKHNYDANIMYLNFLTKKKGIVRYANF